MFLSQVSKSAVYCQALARPDCLPLEGALQAWRVVLSFMQVLALFIKRLKAEECFYLFERSEL